MNTKSFSTWFDKLDGKIYGDARRGNGNLLDAEAGLDRVREWREAFEFGKRLGADGKRKPVIFVPTDFSDDSLEAVKAGVTAAKQTGGQLVLFHAVHLNLTPFGPANPARLRAELRSEAAEKAEPLMSYAQAAGVSVTCVVEEGAQAEAILKSAARWQAAMIVLTSCNRGRLARLFRRSIVSNVVRAAKCPVMVLRKKTNFLPQIDADEHR